MKPQDRWEQHMEVPRNQGLPPPCVHPSLEGPYTSISGTKQTQDPCSCYNPFLAGWAQGNVQSRELLEDLLAPTKTKAASVKEVLSKAYYKYVYLFLIRKHVWVLTICKPWENNVDVTTSGHTPGSQSSWGNTHYQYVILSSFHSDDVQFYLRYNEVDTTFVPKDTTSSVTLDC